MTCLHLVAGLGRVIGVDGEITAATAGGEFSAGPEGQAAAVVAAVTDVHGSVAGGAGGRPGLGQAAREDHGQDVLAPGRAAKDGCTIFVRLWQYREGDHTQIVRQPGEGEQAAPRAGASAATVLFDDGHEEVRLEDWKAGETVTVANTRGLEFIVLSGQLTIDGEILEPQSWARLPAGTDLTAFVGSEGVRLWLKDAPLLHSDVLEMPA